jgi:hypothetical protein
MNQIALTPGDSDEETIATLLSGGLGGDDERLTGRRKKKRDDRDSGSIAPCHYTTCIVSIPTLRAGSGHRTCSQSPSSCDRATRNLYAVFVIFIHSYNESRNGWSEPDSRGTKLRYLSSRASFRIAVNSEIVARAYTWSTTHSLANQWVSNRLEPNERADEKMHCPDFPARFRWW